MTYDALEAYLDESPEDEAWFKEETERLNKRSRAQPARSPAKLARPPVDDGSESDESTDPEDMNDWAEGCGY